MLIRRRWAFALSGVVTFLIVLLGYYAQPMRYRVFGLYSPHKAALRAETSQEIADSQITPGMMTRVLDFISLRNNGLAPEAKFIKDDDLLQEVIQTLQIKDFGGNPASPRSLRRRLFLSKLDQGDTIKISLDEPDPTRARQIIDQLMASYVAYFSAETPEESVSFNRVIQPQLVNAETLSKQTQQALYQIQLGSSQPPLTTSIRAGDQTLELQSIGISTQQQLSTIDADLAILNDVLSHAKGNQRALMQQVIALGAARRQLLVQLRDTLGMPRDAATLSTALETLERQGLVLNKELTLTQTQYTRFLGKQQTPWAVTQSKQNSAAVIRPAAVPTQGSRPFFPLFLGAGLVSGLLVGGLVAYVMDRRDTSLSSLSDIYHQLQLPILGVIPAFSIKDLSIQSLARQEKTEFHEFAKLMTGYRWILQQFSVISLDRIPQVMSFTSMKPGEGKSLTAANLAYLLTREGKKVLLLDADLFAPSQFQLWGVSQAVGLCDCMAGDIQLGKALQRLHPSLDLLQSGYPTKNKSILLNSPGISLLMRELRTRYDHILVDTPALSESVHGYLLANSADVNLLVLRPSSVESSDIEQLKEILGRSGTQLWGMLVNDFNQSPNAFGSAALIQESQWDATLRLQKPKKLIGLEISTLSSINPPDEMSEPGDDLHVVKDPAARQRRKKQEDYLYQLPLDEVKKLVNVLWDDWSHDIELLLEQEEEMMQQSRVVRALQAQVKDGNPYLKLSSELQLKDEKEKLNVLAETYVGQRSALIDEKADLTFYLEILFARTDAEYIPQSPAQMHCNRED